MSSRTQEEERIAGQLGQISLAIHEMDFIVGKFHKFTRKQRLSRSKAQRRKWEKLRKQLVEECLNVQAACDRLAGYDSDDSSD